MSLISSWIEKGRKIKSRGIALTHKDQGYSANNRPISLLTKSDIEPEKLTVEIVKALEQVELKISMEEFLRRFFDLWSSDAELLTKILGFTTEFEQSMADNPPNDDSWEAEWNEKHQKYLNDKLQSISIIQKAKNGEALSLTERYQLVGVRKAFESGCETEGTDFGDSPTIQSASGASKTTKTDVKEVVKATDAPTESSAGALNNTNEEIPVEKEVDVTKSAAFIELQKSMQEQTELMKAMQAQVADAQEIIKAQKAAKRAVAVEKAASFGFVGADQLEAVADVVENTNQAVILAVLEKAAADLKAKDEALAAKDTEIADIKKSFADGKEIGAQGDLTDKAKGSEDAQARLDAIIKSRTALQA